MFHSLIGNLSGHSFPHVFLRTGGVEWQIEVSATTFQECVRSTGEIRLFTHLYHREDAMKLYGFFTVEERSAFLELLTVAGIGPRQAQKILSNITVPALLQLLEEEDVVGLTRLPGLGTKTAQKIILQLKGRLVSPDTTGTADRDDDITRALVEMGFDRVRVQKTLTELRNGSTADPNDEQELFHHAIIELSNRQ